MQSTIRFAAISTLVVGVLAPTLVRAQDDRPPPPPFQDQTPSNVPPGGPEGMMRGAGGPFGEEREILVEFDANGDGWLNLGERDAARIRLKEIAAQDGGRRGGGRGPGGGRPTGRGEEEEEPVGPGPRVATSDVKVYPDAALYEPTVLRTLFIEFERDDWETELSDFHNTDVDVPCTLTVDGKTYHNVGVHFRGASSYMMVGPGHKRSLNLAMDLVEQEQALYGARTLNLLNSHHDPSFMSSILYSHIAGQHIPTPRSNFVRVVINGESWGVFINVEQFNKEFLEANFGTSKGTRWKVKGSPMATSGLDYIGDDIAPYKQKYQIKSGSSKKDWQALVELCRTLSETPLDQLEEALEPMLDIDGVLWFLALDNTLVNCDGYWIRASDYNLYRDPNGVFHVIPHDMNESFISVVNAPGFGGRGPGGRGRQGQRGGPPPNDGGNPPDAGQAPDRGRPPADMQPVQARGGNTRPTGIELDPLIGMQDAHKPLRSRLLSVPNLRARYLEYVRQIAEESLSWDNLGPVVAQHRALIEDEIEIDTRKLTSFAAFQQSTANDPPPAPADGGRPSRSLRAFADGRRAFLLAYKEPVAGQATAAPKTGESTSKDSER